MDTADLQEQQAPPIDETWPWPEFPRHAPRNLRRMYTEPFTGWEGDFLAAYRMTGIIRASCVEARVSSNTVARMRKQSPAFEQAMMEAKDEAIDRMEAAALNRAVVGTTRTKGVYHQGKRVGEETITEYSDTLLIFLLKANRPEKYRDSVDHNHRMTAMHEEAKRISEQEGIPYDDIVAEAERFMKASRK